MRGGGRVYQNAGTASLVRHSGSWARKRGHILDKERNQSNLAYYGMAFGLLPESELAESRAGGQVAFVPWGTGERGAGSGWAGLGWLVAVWAGETGALSGTLGTGTPACAFWGGLSGIKGSEDVLCRPSY